MVALRVIDTIADGVPLEYSKMTASGIHQPVQKFQANQYLLRSQIMNEHCSIYYTVIDTVTATNIVGQIFKASLDNINTILLALESTGSSVVDDFESYADDAALQAVWVKNGLSDATLETVFVGGSSSTKSMEMPMDSVTNEWVKTVAAVDYTGYTGKFEFMQNQDYSKAKISVFIGDGTNTKSISLVSLLKDVWDTFEISETAMIEDGGGTTDITAITKIGFRVTDRDIGKSAYLDNFITIVPPGEVEIKLWDFGTTLPTGTDALSDATQYITLGDLAQTPATSSVIFSLGGGKRLYHIDGFIAGVAKEDAANNLLTIDNYYAITINYVDTDVIVHGISSPLYNNGFAFTVPDTATAITPLAKDIGFGIYSTQDIYIVRMFWNVHTSAHTLAAPGDNASIMIVAQDVNLRLEDIMLSHVFPPVSMDRGFDTSPYSVEDGGKVIVYYEDDYTDNVVDMYFSIQYRFIPPTVNG